MRSSKHLEKLTTGIVGARGSPHKSSLAAKLLSGVGFIAFSVCAIFFQYCYEIA